PDLAEVVELWQTGAGSGTVRDEAGRQPRQRPLELSVGQRDAHILLEGLRRRLHRAILWPASGVRRSSAWRERDLGGKAKGLLTFLTRRSADRKFLRQALPPHGEPRSGAL